jgi:hypothetical protein
MSIHWNMGVLTSKANYMIRAIVNKYRERKLKSLLSRVKKRLKSEIRKRFVIESTFCIMELLVRVICKVKAIVKTSLKRALTYYLKPETVRSFHGQAENYSFSQRAEPVDVAISLDELWKVVKC